MQIENLFLNDFFIHFKCMFKVLNNITNNQGNADQNDNEVSSYTC